ncbi:hypothetical protein L0B53_16990 [Vibrio sp. SS-MA-C1-2]|uniref:fimbrial protein n=1 Tax=Vibrio sp. SS-MA-C1-2 TaxID=2908646 RepID=UPI001F1F96BA|nr:fimbrial protein [Vibrio sp. SS-MA-C1-2]UJF18681.1 hypothetical protein L0B53_16990 [Vibrio sp. SS-MA-C1-2]
MNNECQSLTGVELYHQQFQQQVENSENYSGKLIANALQYSNGKGGVELICQSGYNNRAGNERNNVYLSATTSYPVHRQGRNNYIQITPEISVASYYSINGKGHEESVPFSGKRVPTGKLKLMDNDRQIDTDKKRSIFTTQTKGGGEGKIDIKFTQPISGRVHFNGLISQLYAGLNNHHPKRTAIAETYLNLDLMIPAQCTLREGSTMSIDLGTVASRDLTLNQKPQGYSPREIKLNFDCNVDGDVRLGLMGVASKDNHAFMTSNKGIALLIEDNGEIVEPNKMTTLALSGNRGRYINSKDKNNKNNIDFKAEVYPVKTDNDVISAGPYQGAISISIEVL